MKIHTQKMSGGGGRFGAGGGGRGLGSGGVRVDVNKELEIL